MRRRLYGYHAVYPGQPLFARHAEGHKDHVELDHILPKGHGYRDGVWTIEIRFTPAT